MKSLFSLISFCLLASFAANAQAILEADINPGTSSSYPGIKTVYNGKLYYESVSDSTSWGLRSFTGETETLEVEYPVIGVAMKPPFLINYDGKLFFLAHDTNTTNFGPNTSTLWSYDGTTAAIEATNVILNGAQNVITGKPAVYNGRLYFQAFGSSDHGRELWSFDGESTTLVRDIRPGIGGSDPFNLVVYDNKLFFSAKGDGVGVELWSYDSVNDTLILETDIASEFGSSKPIFSVVYDGKLYFSATDGIAGRELWSFDGTEATLEADINPGADSSNPYDLTIFNNKLFFSAYDGINDPNLWSFDGTTVMPEIDINPDNNYSLPSEFTVYGEKLFFSASTDETGKELWSYDGTTAMMEAEIQIGAGGSEPNQMTVFENKLFFTARVSWSGKELWSFYDVAVSVEETSNEQGIHIYPNPTSGNIHIKLTSEAQNVTVSIYNLLGERIHTKNLGTVSSFNYQLPETKGMYIVQLESANGNTKNIKVIKE